MVGVGEEAFKYFALPPSNATIPIQGALDFADVLAIFELGLVELCTITAQEAYMPTARESFVRTDLTTAPAETSTVFGSLLGHARYLRILRRSWWGREKNGDQGSEAGDP
jgi:hypothetical protein